MVALLLSLLKMLIKNKYFCLLVLFFFVDCDLKFGATEDVRVDQDINIGLHRFKRQAIRPCFKNEFQCDNGRCVPQYAVCDGRKNCVDGSDEKWETCEKKFSSSCVLPAHNTEKSFVLNCNSGNETNIFSSSRGELVEKLTLLSFDCNAKRQPQQHFKSVCLKGEWTPPYTDCLRACPSIKRSQNANLKCYMNNQEIDCEREHFSGTIIRPKCSANFVPSVEESVCQNNAQWSTGADKIECISCGVIKNNTPPFQFPWTVAIFIKDALTLTCAGTIISSNIIITAASCFTGYKGDDPNNYLVLVGKSRRVFNEENAPFQRPYSIKQIILHDNFQENNFSNDIAILQLSDKITYNAGVYPVCLEWDESKYKTLTDSSVGEIANYIVNEATTMFNSEWEGLIRSNIELQYITNDECYSISPLFKSRFLMEEKFCARLKTKQPLILIDKGTGFVVKNPGNKYVLRGIASGMYSAAKTYRIFSDIFKYLKWISTNLNFLASLTNLMNVQIQTRYTHLDAITSDDSIFNYNILRINCTAGEIHKEFIEGCRLPSKNSFHIEFEIICADNIFQGYCNRSIENSPVPQFTRLLYRCQQDYASYSHEEFESFCIKKQWNRLIQRCNKICEKLILQNVRLECVYENQRVNCDENLIVNTEIRATCLPQFKSNTTNWTGSIFCREDRKWSAPLLQCIPMCGIPSKIKITPTILHGDNATLGEFPWHAAVYDITHQNLLICGATIISPHAFISAAHCFYNSTIGQYRNAEEYEIAVSKITRDYKKRDSETTNFYKVESLIFNNFEGSKLQYQLDIVIIVTKTEIRFNAQVSPVCLFENTQIEIPSRSTSDVAGWGTDETSLNGSTILKVAHLPYISFDECSKLIPSTIKHFLIVDKFCVEFSNGTTLEKGDSGGGLVRQNPSDNFYYLMGIVSIRASDQATMAFSTNVLKYTDWIRTHLDKINR